MFRKISPPPGWTKQDLLFTAILARFHRRALPYPDHTKLRGLDAPLRQSLIRLAAIFRLADAFRASRTARSAGCKWRTVQGFCHPRRGLFRSRPGAVQALEARRFLEFVFQRSVHILAPGTRMLVPRMVRPASRSDAA